ncbi:hypothetical protein [Pseudoduganella violaceinigra]|uniref:hypothetical protein n=1 Tax=Pseudoduganella violaceinigra TaxID=246602 RepID=UPI0004814300|nr:hypothetical protein [Pseudoduganella violaceinigra]
MKQSRHEAAMTAELSAAIGLVWGHIGAMQHEEAYALSSACLELWPGERHLRLLAVYAGAELGHAADLASLRQEFGEQPCLDLMARRQPA